MITIRGKGYQIAVVTDAIARTISQHVDTAIPLSVRHQSTWEALNACLEPELPTELFKKGILLLNDAEIIPILQAIAEALTADQSFKQSLTELADASVLDEETKEAIAELVEPSSVELSPQFTKEEIAMVMAVRSAKG